MFSCCSCCWASSWGAARAHFWPKNSPKIRFFYATPIKSLFFGLRRTWLNEIITSTYPEVTLDNFSFPVDGRLAARRAVSRPRLPKVALFGSGRVFIASTPNFGPSLTKLVGTIRFTKKMTHNDNGAGPGRIYGETAVFTFCRKAENGPKIRFFPKKIPKFAKRLIFIWEKGTFFFWQLCPVVARTWLGVKSEGFFLAPKIRFSARN